jgi:hypothetical protein
MGDKGKKDKEKVRKQKIVKQKQSAKKAEERVPIGLPLHKHWHRGFAWSRGAEAWYRVVFHDARRPLWHQKSN